MLSLFYDGGLDVNSNMRILCCRGFLGVGFLVAVLLFVPIPTFYDCL
jgi:hypothetical protein